jgi:hypothetical protein
MGSSSRDLLLTDQTELASLADRLAEAICSRGCVLITGATTGLPDLVARRVKARGGLAIGISPASSEAEHTRRYSLPVDSSEVIIYTGFGLKGRNVINIRASDVVIIFGGATGTLNEFTIAYDEGRIIGVLEGSGGIADHIREVINYCHGDVGSQVFFNSDAAALLDACLGALQSPSRP